VPAPDMGTGPQVSTYLETSKLILIYLADNIDQIH
jgi:hypothetical protein